MKKWWIPALVVYFCSLLWFSFGVPGTFLSPDESAAFTFARAFKETGIPAVVEPINEVVQGGIVRPRSSVVLGAFIVPGSFLGMPLLTGALGHVVGTAGMLYVTPMLAVFTLLAWYRVILALFREPRVAMVATVLVAAHPAFWLYAARSMMHNVAFVAFLVFAAWWVVARPLSQNGERRVRRLSEFAFAGVCVGTALTLRTSEALWVGLGVFALAMLYRRHLTAKHALAFVAAASIPLIVVIMVQANVYGSPLATGYTVTATPAVSAAAEVSVAQAEPLVQQWLQRAASLLVPFGIHERAIVKNVWHFAIQLFPWMSVLAAAGVVLAWKAKGIWRGWTIGTLVLAAWLAVVYGSWSFNDNPDPTAVTLADSHVRYWLPVFVLLSPLAAVALLRITAHRVWQGVLCVAVVACSFALVFFSQDGLHAGRAELFESAHKRDVILAHTEEDAVVVVDRADKFLWPYRRVVVPLRNETTYARMPVIAQEVPLYYFGIPFPPKDIEYLNTEKLFNLGLRIDLVTTAADEALYRITPRPYAPTN